jgi:hypothetical protein
MSSNSTPGQIHAALPHRTPRQLSQIRKYYGIACKRRQLSPTGFPLIDAIRTRCIYLNYSMVDLDKLAGTKQYFQKAAWLNGGIRYRAIGRAVAALDGELTVRWRDE